MARASVRSTIRVGFRLTVFRHGAWESVAILPSRNAAHHEQKRKYTNVEKYRVTGVRYRTGAFVPV